MFDEKLKAQNLSDAKIHDRHVMCWPIANLTGEWCLELKTNPHEVPNDRFSCGNQAREYSSTCRTEVFDV